MNKKLGWMLKPRFSVFFVALIGFSIAALAMGYYVLAGVEFAVSALLCKAITREDLRSFRRRK